MAVFRKNFNCCKTVFCKNFGIVESDDYTEKSERLGFWSTECHVCGSNSPWIKNSLVNDVFSEKFTYQFGRKLTGCPKCNDTFFLTDRTETKRYGFTSAGTQRKKCLHCGTIFSAANIKNESTLHALLIALMTNNEMSEAIKETGLSARLFYFYLNKLAVVLSNFSRLQEASVLRQDQLAMHTQGGVLRFMHGRGIYTLTTAETNSGYILLQSHNLTHKNISEYYSYNEKQHTFISTIASDNIENILIDRYQQHLQRNHFEQLLVGEMKPVSKCHLIYPDKLAYVHFQLLNVFVEKVDSYSHYIDHESSFRSAVLMAAYPDIKAGKVGIYFFFPCASITPFSSHGKEIGWWKDRWFSNEFGAYSPIVCGPNESVDIKRSLGNSLELFYTYLDAHLYKGINSMTVVNNFLEIQRVIFNYCELDGVVTRANKLRVTDKIYTPELLLVDALKHLMKE